LSAPIAILHLSDRPSSNLGIENPAGSSTTMTILAARFGVRLSGMVIQSLAQTRSLLLRVKPVGLELIDVNKPKVAVRGIPKCNEPTEGAGFRLFGYETKVCNKRGMSGMLVERTGTCNTFLGHATALSGLLLRLRVVQLRITTSITNDEDELSPADHQVGHAFRVHRCVQITHLLQLGV
jgi:hypothetical protein